MSGLEAAGMWVTRTQHGDTVGDTSEGEPSFSAHSPSSHRSSTSCAGSPEHKHEAEAAAPTKRRRRADQGLVSTPTEESLFSLDVASTPSFDAVFSNDVDVSPCDDVPPCAYP